MKQTYGIKTARRAQYLREQERAEAILAQRVKIERNRNLARQTQVRNATLGGAK